MIFPTDDYPCGTTWDPATERIHVAGMLGAAQCTIAPFWIVGSACRAPVLYVDKKVHHGESTSLGRDLGTAAAMLGIVFTLPLTCSTAYPACVIGGVVGLGQGIARRRRYDRSIQE
jgi:hypothetical protein